MQVSGGSGVHTPTSVIKGFFRYEGIDLKATVTEMGDAERLLLWLRVNGFKVVPMTHLDCTDD